MDDIESAPFIFGVLADSTDFANREEEVKRILTNTNSGISTIIISPRRWGKTSVVKKAGLVGMKKDKKLRVCFLDVFNIRSEEEFYEEFAKEVIKASSNKWNDIINNTKKYLSAFIPKISIKPDGINDFSLSLSVDELRKHPNEILNLPEVLAKDKKIKFLICIDEFQNIAGFENPLAFQKKLRSHWQHHKLTNYCLYGSKRHMMLDVFSSQSMPFYKFGDIMFLDKIKESEWKKFIKKRFVATGKGIDIDAVLMISRLVENHPYYVQQLAQLSWFRSTNNKCTVDIVNQAHEGLINQLSLLFQNLTDGLSNAQVYYLHALLDGVKKMTSKETISKYKLGTSATALKAKKSLINKEIIDDWNGVVDVLDPLYKSWLKKRYFIR